MTRGVPMKMTPMRLGPLTFEASFSTMLAQTMVRTESIRSIGHAKKYPAILPGTSPARKSQTNIFIAQSPYITLFVHSTHIRMKTQDSTLLFKINSLRGKRVALTRSVAASLALECLLCCTMNLIAGAKLKSAIPRRLSAGFPLRKGLGNRWFPN